MDIIKGLGWFNVSLLLLMQIIGASSLLCYLCQDLPDNEQCFNVVKCTASEVCYGKTEKLASGNITHTTGCRDLQVQPMQEQGRVTVCNEHCQENFCNLRSCASNATLTRVPPRCPSCDYVHQPEDCKHVTQCKQNEQCFVHKFNAFGLTRYRMGCVSQEHCAETAHGNAGPAIIGKRSTTSRFSTGDCLVCCSKDHCSANACHNQSTALGVSALQPLSNGHTCNDSSTCKTFGLLDEDACRQRQVVDVCPVSCQTCGFFGWQSWQAWSSCDTSCGTGTKTRQRQCQSQIDIGSVTHCAGDSRQTASCSSGQCSADGKWSAWGAWQTCSATCGGGNQHRTRVCQYDPAMPRGSACVGAVKQKQHCGQSACPSTTVAPVDPHSTKCDVHQVDRYLQQQTSASDPRAHRCQDGKHTSPEALLFDTCHNVTNFNVTSWNRGLHVLSQCRSIPQGEPIAFYMGSRPILPAIFWKCLPVGGFEIVYQGCHSSGPSVVDLSTTPVFPMYAFYTVSW